MHKLSTLLLLLLSASVVYGDPVGTLYIKNNGDCFAYIWVNNQYQGYVPAGKARYTVQEGFVTNDSGFQTDGTLKQTYSHAGWESSGDTISVLINLEDSKGKLYSVRIDVSGDKEHKGYVWFGEQESGEEPDSLVWEDSSQIQSERQPITKKYADANAYAATKGDDARGFIGAWQYGGGGEFLVGGGIITFYANGTWRDVGKLRNVFENPDYDVSGTWYLRSDGVIASGDGERSWKYIDGKLFSRIERSGHAESGPAFTRVK